MVLIEILLFLFLLLLFLVTDSRTIHIAAGNLLSEYNVSYSKISGNLFSGIEVNDLKYQNKILLESAKIHWNPLALAHKSIEITQLDIQRVESSEILTLLSQLPPSDQSESNPKIELDIVVKRINLSAKPFERYGIKFKNIYLGTNRLSLDKKMTISSDLIHLALDSELANLDLTGRFEQKNLNLNDLRLMEIDPKAITRLVRNLRKAKRAKAKKTSSNKQASTAPLFLEKINVDRLTATMKKTTYNPITIDKTKVIAKKLSIDIAKGFAYNAKYAMISTKTSFADTKQVGYIKNSMFYGKGNLITTPYLFSRYALPLNQKELYKIPAKLKLNHQGVWVEVEHAPKNLLALKNSDFNINLDTLTHHFDYRYLDFYIKIHSQGKGKINYADEVTLDNLVFIDFRKKVHTSYEGSVQVNKIKNLPKMVSDNLLTDLNASYKGDTKQLLVNVQSQEIEGRFLSKGYKRATLDLKSKFPLVFSKFLSFLPHELASARGDLSSSSTIEFKDPSQSVFTAKIDSNLLNLDASMMLKKPYHIAYEGSVPRDSLLYHFDPKLKLSSVNSFHGAVTLGERMEHVSFHSGEIDLSLDYLLNEKILQYGLLNIDNQQIFFEGGVNKRINVSTDIKEVSKLFAIIMKYYDVQLPDIQGGIDLKLQYHAKKGTDITFKSKSISHPFFSGDIAGTMKIFKNGETTLDVKSKAISILSKGEVKQRLRLIDAKLALRGEEIEISNYALTLLDNPYIKRIKSTKPSYLHYKNGMVKSKGLWIDDRVYVTGHYNTKTLKGKLKLDSDHFRYQDKDFDLLANLKLKLSLDSEKIYIFGNIKLLESLVTYELMGSGLSEDSDIIIVQEQREKEQSSLNNIKTYITIENEVPLNYRAKDIDVDLMNEITVVKEYNKDFRLLGLSRVVGGYFQQEDKKFYLADSEIYFYGDPKKPILDIIANYQKDRYDIHIYISGSSDDPIINFSSDPYLSQRDILSLILFDTSTSDSGSGTAIYAMLGGTFAKELMKSLGVNVDHLLLGEGIDETLSVEVGQKISDNITVIYQHENGRDGVKVRVDHSKNFETDIIIQPPNTSSIEFLYKSD